MQGRGRAVQGERCGLYVKRGREFPDGPVVRTPCFHCWEAGFSPWSGNYDPASRVVVKLRKQTNNNKNRGK